jgi:superoxide dismutase, Fe-Mn family
MPDFIMVPPGQHKLPPLPYQYNALEPVISASTMHFHHDFHHKTYVDDLNKTELKLVEARKAKDFSNIKALENDLAFNSSGHILHSIFWTIMTSPRKIVQPSPELTNFICTFFGDLDAFKGQFTNAALKVEGSG